MRGHGQIAMIVLYKAGGQLRRSIMLMLVCTKNRLVGRKPKEDSEVSICKAASFTEASGFDTEAVPNE